MDFLDRLAQHKTVEVVADVAPVLLGIEVPGQLDTLHFKKDKDAVFLPDANEVDIDARVIELGLADYSVVTGYTRVRLSSRRQSLDHGRGKCKTVARAPAALVTNLPTDMSFEQVFSLLPGSLTVIYAMHQAIRNPEVDTMLLRCSKMFLEAAVQMVIAAKVDLYIVAEDETKKEILSRTNLPETYIISGPRFSKSMKMLLGEHGVDVILNSVDEDITQCFDCLPPFGTFVDIVDHRDSSSSFRNQQVNSNITVITINSALIARQRPRMLTPAMEKVFALAAAGTLEPFADLNAYPLSQANGAFEELGA